MGFDSWDYNNEAVSHDHSIASACGFRYTWLVTTSFSLFPLPFMCAKPHRRISPPFELGAQEKLFKGMKGCVFLCPLQFSSHERFKFTPNNHYLGAGGGAKFKKFSKSTLKYFYYMVNHVWTLLGVHKLGLLWDTRLYTVQKGNAEIHWFLVKCRKDFLSIWSQRTIFVFNITYTGCFNITLVANFRV